MAKAIPDSLPSKASGGEDRLFRILKRLPDDVVIYYEPEVDHRHPDFVVILPTLGVLIIETKGWYLANIVAADSNSVRVQEGDHEAIRAPPIAPSQGLSVPIDGRGVQGQTIREACAPHWSA